MWQFDILTNKFVPGSLPANGKITACYTRLSQEDEFDLIDNCHVYGSDIHFPLGGQVIVCIP